MTGRQMYKMLALLGCALTLSGCEGQLTVFGNIFCMGITCAMLWSTVHLDKN